MRYITIAVGLHALLWVVTFSRGQNHQFGPILFVSRQVHDRSSVGTDQLYAMNEDGTNIRQIIADSFNVISDAKWTPDGRQVVVAADSLFAVDLET